MSKEMRFFIYLLEQYAHEKGIPSCIVLQNWDEQMVTDYIYGMYELYHSEAIENAFKDIDMLVSRKKM